MKIQDKEYVILDGIKLYLDKDCCDLVNEKIAKRKVEFKELPNNYLKGFLGAFLGGFVGLLLWVLIGGVLGYVSGWMSFFVFWLSDMGYSLFKGKINHKKSFMVSMVTLIFSFLGLLFSYFILANKLDVNFSNFFDSSLMGVFVGDLVLAVILYIVGVIRIVKRVDGILLELSK